MPFAALAVSLVVASAPGASPLGRPAASTYDDATCALVTAGDADDGWDRAAIGEDAPRTAEPADCAAALPAEPGCGVEEASLWAPGLQALAARCMMPQLRELLAPRPRLGRARDPHRAPHLTLFATSSGEATAPAAQAAPDHDLQPAVLTGAVAFHAPDARGAPGFAPPRRLRSVPRGELLRPPRA